MRTDYTYVHAHFNIICTLLDSDSKPVDLDSTASLLFIWLYVNHTAGL